MSHDQKPAKIRLVSGPAAVQQQRRRGDASAGGAGGDPLADASAAPMRGYAPLLAILFIVGCAIGGAALPFFGIA